MKYRLRGSGGPRSGGPLMAASDLGGPEKYLREDREGFGTKPAVGVVRVGEIRAEKDGPPPGGR